MKKSYGSLIDGTWVKHKKSFLVHDPFNNSKISKVFDAEESGTIKAINSAHDSFKKWRKIPALFWGMYHRW